DDITFTVQRLREALAPRKARLIIVGADEEQPLARRGIGIKCDHGYTRRNRLVDTVFQSISVCNRKQDARCFLLHGLIKSITLGLGIICLRSGEISADLELRSRVAEAGAGGLPIRNLQICGHEDEILVRIMSIATTHKDDTDCRGGQRTENSTQAEHRTLL